MTPSWIEELRECLKNNPLLKNLGIYFDIQNFPSLDLRYSILDVVEQSDTITSFFQPFLFTEVFRKEVQERLKQLKTLCQKNMTHICMGGQTNETLMNNRESVTFIRYFNGSFNEAIKESLSYKKIKKLSFFNMNLPQKEKALKLTDE